MNTVDAWTVFELEAAVSQQDDPYRRVRMRRHPAESRGGENASQVSQADAELTTDASHAPPETEPCTMPRRSGTEKASNDPPRGQDAIRWYV